MGLLFSIVWADPHLFWVFRDSYITHHCPPLVIWAAFVRLKGQWFEDVPDIFDLWTRASRPVLTLSADLFRYWGRMMWERVGVENRPPFITDLGRFLGAGVLQARRVSVAEGRFLA